MPPTILARSERVALTPIGLEHAPLMVRWRNDPAIFGHIRGHIEKTDLPEQERWIASLAANPRDRVLIILLADSDEPIGYGGFMHLEPEDGTAEVGWAIGERERHGQGLGSESLWLFCRYGFEALGLHNIMAEHYADNLISARALARVGFRRYGTRRESRCIEGRRLNVHYSDLLRHELLDPRPSAPRRQ
jgi:RimJ/RimL family protein N-acetyltransferase